MLLIIIVAGITGYMFIEGDGFLNALYMTIITISTVGFGEIHKLSIAGKIFTIILILSSRILNRNSVLLKGMLLMMKYLSKPISNPPMH